MVLAHDLRGLVILVEFVMFVGCFGPYGIQKLSSGNKTSAGRLAPEIGTLAISSSPVTLQFPFKLSSCCVALFWCGGHRNSRFCWGAPGGHAGTTYNARTTNFFRLEIITGNI